MPTLLQGLDISTAVKIAQIAATMALFQGGAIGIYAGPRPAHSDYATSGTLLGWISNAGYPWSPGSLGAGLRFVQSGAFMLNDATQPWICQPLATGVATWFRLYSPLAAENFLQRYDMPRIDGDVGKISDDTNAQLQLPSTSFAPGHAFPITYFGYTIPPILS